MLDIFLVGAIGFWIILALELIILIACIHGETFAGSTFSLVLFGCFVYFVAGYDFVSVLLSSPWLTLAFLGLYFVIGILWSCFKFYLVYDKKLTEMRKGYIEGYHGKDINSYISQHAPTVGYYKDRIILWMTYWPISILWFLISDFIQELFNVIYNKIYKLYQKIANHIISKNISKWNEDKLEKEALKKETHTEQLK